MSNEIEVNHTFIVDSIKKLDFCGTEILQFSGGQYTIPYDIVKREYEDHNHKECNGCKKNYLKIFTDISAYHKKFPNCCELHEKLATQKWFKANAYENAPFFYTEKLFHVWDHVLNFIDKKEWEEEIFDYLDHVIDSFGCFPSGYGEALYFGRFITQLQGLITGNIKGNLERKNKILEYLNKYKNPIVENDDRDFNILAGIYSQWHKTFPFELSYFAHLKQQYVNINPLIESVKYNKYSNLHIATPKTKKFLINYLLEITNKILVIINTETLLEKGLITDIEKIELEMIRQKRKQKLKQGYTNSSKSDETKYRKILKEWLKDELQFIKEIKPIIEKNPFVAFSDTNPLLNDLMRASYKLQENKIFWNADEDTRTRQILDLLPQKYEAKDQSRYGESGTGIKQGSVDGVIKDSSETEYFLEAFNLEYIDTNNITSHINKLEQNYDSKGLYNKYVIVYCNLPENKFEDFTKSYQQFIEAEMKFLYPKNGDSMDVESKYTNNRILKTSHIREGKEVFLYHILLKFPQKEK
ncbi:MULTISPECIES: hypothetical protein [Chryseobacterium]|uniref:hypothetical protein n=1 Tax=Chryseobacterium TaxID=59732 RepID=UPI0019598E4D|nr:MULTISPECIES: hypothetical protein [Chryseobacterium]MBM7419711.1 hypothetical protein [Chryseobacterium sp. JUb44]MDH6209644.1 hypothetical protein [Chryseobacterium sp. BIGb0186]WSO08397.1 hypothetical protein VUJ64_11210 [Chryseobacterium scophthalmum]